MSMYNQSYNQNQMNTYIPAPITVEVYANNLFDFQDRYRVSRNLAIACDIINRADPDVQANIHEQRIRNQQMGETNKAINFPEGRIVVNAGVKCIQFQNFQGVVLVLNGKYACQEPETFNLLDNSPWISKACTPYAEKIYNQIRSIDEFGYLRTLPLKDDGNMIQVEIEKGVVVVVDQAKYERHRDVFSGVFKSKKVQKKFNENFLNIIMKK